MSDGVRKIHRALISVSDKTGIAQLGRFLHEQGVEILSTGGTARELDSAGIPVVEVSDYTGFPEMLDGRVKTLHPKIHGGILHRRDFPEDLKAIASQGIDPIDLIVVNLYPFEQTVAKPDCTLADAIENIDIGGPSMLRAAAKNHNDVTVIVDPEDYKALFSEMKEQGGATTAEFRLALAKKVFIHTAHYDGAIAQYLTSRPTPESEPALFPDYLSIDFGKVQDLRYGENPHQQAAFYGELDPKEPCLAQARQLHGKELSYNNILDLDAALGLVREFDQPAAVVVKHNNPCGAALGGTLAEAYKNARATDPTSAFGGIVALNRPVDEETADLINETFIEAVIAPGFPMVALGKLQQKKNIRLLSLAFEARRPTDHLPGISGWELRRVAGGLLVQDFDRKDAPMTEWKVVTKRQPSTEEMEALHFAWICCKHVKSNAIVFANAGQLVGVGAGQMSRVDSTKIATLKAELPIKGTAAASDAFFPFRDGLDQLAEAGVSAVIQPGGSVRDEEVIAAADEHGLAMVFTGYRHFRH